MQLFDKEFKSGKSLSASIEQEFHNDSVFNKVFGFELFTFQVWLDRKSQYMPDTKSSLTIRLTILSICLRIHYYWR